MRLGPDGKPIAFQVEVNATAKESIDALNLIKGSWQKVGVDLQVKVEDRALLYTRKNANEHDAVVWGGGGGQLDAILDPRHYFPYSDESNFAQAWSVWFARPANPRVEPEEPPPAAKQQMDLYRQLEATGDTGRQYELMERLLRIAQEEFWCIGTTLPTNGYGIVKNTMKNVPRTMPGAWQYPTPGPTNPQQYFFER